MQIEILNPSYSEWVLLNTSTKQKYKFINNQFIGDENKLNEPVATQIMNFKNNPYDYKLFTGDIIDGGINIILNSEYRSSTKYIPGILILNENKI